MKGVARNVRCGWAAGILLSILAFPAVSARAADMLDVRMVEATQVQQPRDPRLRDVQHLLESNLPFASFVMIERVAVSAVDGTATLEGGYTLRARGGSDLCRLTLERDGKTILQTQIRLKGDKPLVLGGFQGRKGKILLVIQAR